MTAFFVFLLVFLVVAISILYPGWRDKRILKGPFPPAWKKIVDRRLPFFQELGPSEQQQVLDLIRLFIARKQFHGCGGLQINDDIRVTIAAEACLLLLNRKTGIYPALKHILVYPDAFQTNREQHHFDGTVSAGPKGLLGESWSNGKVILSWNDVENGVGNFEDGHNVVLHEFSHQLDTESGSANGAPPLKRNSYQIWSKVLSTEFSSLIKAMDDQHKTVMDYYGATNPAEFFAVATETFFEKPKQMEKKHPELFEELKKYYCVDPRIWS